MSTEWRVYPGVLPTVVWAPAASASLRRDWDGQALPLPRGIGTCDSAGSPGRGRGRESLRPPNLAAGTKQLFQEPVMLHDGDGDGDVVRVQRGAWEVTQPVVCPGLEFTAT